jgi:hypothetical protein
MLKVILSTFQLHFIPFCGEMTHLDLKICDDFWKTSLTNVQGLVDKSFPTEHGCLTYGLK